ncbi:hypothetical protein PM082_011455 [Marasmius tenuissimus]|nr:hypothetical protein PM082_011455 [Marasmius tenuissimus]
MINAGNPLLQIKITESVCAFVAISSTIHRLYIRRGRWWIDDIVSVFMHVENPADILADSFLLFAPLRVLMYLKDKTVRRKLMIIYSTCLITTIVSLVHAVLTFTTGGSPMIISALVEDCASLTVANVPVVIASLFRVAADPDRKPATAGSIISAAVQSATRRGLLN